MTTRAEIVTEARRWLGTPFKHQARVLGEGVDCGGVIVMVARRFGLDQDYTDPVGYPAQPHSDFMERLLDRYTEPVRPEERRAGDIVTLAFGRRLHHLGILSARNRIIHAWNGGPGSCVIETRLTGSFLTGMRRVYKFRGLD